MATTYASDLGNGQDLYLENQGTQTLVTLSSTAPGQQQQQQSGFTTGEWTAPPTLFRLGTRVIARIETDRGSFFVQVQATGMQLVTHTPSLADAEVMPIQQVSQDSSADGNFEPSPPRVQPMEPMKPMDPIKPIKPMKPMKMGDMEMQMSPMQMRMGNMELRMGEPLKPAQQSATPQRFCTQCGSSIAPDDKFCGQCGHQLGH